MATVAINATDHFGLGPNFHPQTSSANTTFERRNIKDENGNFECESMVMEKTDYSTTYRYCNSSPDIKTDLGTFLTAFGYIASGGTEAMFITSMDISFSDGEYADVTLNGVAYGNGTMPGATTGIVANVSAAVPADAGFGVPALPGVTLGANAAAASLTISFSTNHVMATDGAGEFFAGTNISYESSATADYTGIPTTLEPVTGWTTDGTTPADSNEGFDTASWTGHRYFDKT
jgi:hypothetical protein